MHVPRATRNILSPKARAPPVRITTTSCVGHLKPGGIEENALDSRCNFEDLMKFYDWSGTRWEGGGGHTQIEVPRLRYVRAFFCVSREFITIAAGIPPASVISGTCLSRNDLF